MSAPTPAAPGGEPRRKVEHCSCGGTLVTNYDENGRMIGWGRNCIHFEGVEYHQWPERPTPASETGAGATFNDAADYGYLPNIDRAYMHDENAGAAMDAQRQLGDDTDARIAALSEHFAPYIAAAIGRRDQYEYQGAKWKVSPDEGVMQFTIANGERMSWLLTTLRDARDECSRLRATLDAREAESTSFRGFVAGYMAGQSMADRLIMGEAIRVEAMEEASKYVASRAATSLSEEPKP